MKHLLYLLALLVTNTFAIAQQTLSLEEFLSVVKSYHPVARQAALGVEIAKADLLSSRSGFDPQLQSSLVRKEFEGLLYYDHQINELKIPTWYGVDIVSGIESLSGQRTSTPDTKGNTSYVGLSVPIGKGLLMDRRRADLQQAKIFQDLSVQEQRSVLNNLLYDAAEAYWNWWQQHQVQTLFRLAVQNAAERFRLVKAGYRIGERPAIDTVEALAQLQTFQVMEQDILLGLYNTRLAVDVFLWQQNGETYTLPQNTVPQAAMSVSLEAMQLERLMQQVQLHPDLQQYRFKLDALQVERRLKFQSLLPSVYLKYNQLNKTHDLTKSFSTPWLQNNYRYGISVSIPLRFSEGRGEYRKAKFKIEQATLQQLSKRIELQTKLKQYYNAWRQLERQIQLQQQAIASYMQLQRGEEIRFQNGESSLFLVNSREQKTIEAKQKLVELQSKEQKARASVLWAAGALQ